MLPPSIEPHASGHIIEQEELVKQIIDNGFAYESNGSVYFDIEKYNKKYQYGILSHRNLDDVINESRQLDGVGEKRNQADFALWKKASPEHIMRWPSPWSDGFPGWHCECTAMGRKYLGDHFDIHGGGMDLVFPHHECEIAQAVASQGDQMVKYWMHNNMLTINGQKMGKSLGNFITLEQFFTGKHRLLDQAYSPMTIRFFMLSAHYRGTVDFSNDALKASEKGLEKLLNGINDLGHVNVSDKCDPETEKVVKELRQKCYDAMNDDFATPQVISYLFEACTVINKLIDHKATICSECLDELTDTMHTSPSISSDSKTSVPTAAMPVRRHSARLWIWCSTFVPSKGCQRLGYERPDSRRSQGGRLRGERHQGRCDLETEQINKIDNTILEL